MKSILDVAIQPEKKGKIWPKAGKLLTQHDMKEREREREKENIVVITQLVRYAGTQTGLRWAGPKDGYPPCPPAVKLRIRK